MVCGQLDEVIFSDESRVCIAQGDDAGNFVWCHSNEMDKNFPKHS